MRQFYAPTEDLIKTARSWVEDDYAAGITSLNLENVEGFEEGKYVCLGREGDEKSELRRILSISSNTLTLASETLFPHYDNEQVIQFEYNQRKLYRRTSSTGDWAHVSDDSPVDIAVDAPEGSLLEDTSGLASYEYCATYYDSSALTETSTDDAEVVVATTASRNLCSLQRIREAAGWADNFYVADPRIDTARQDSQGEAWAALRKIYTFPLTKYSSFLTRIIVDMAVGYLFIDEYGLDVQNVAKDGYKRLESARGMLLKLVSKEYVLYDEDEEEDQALSEGATPSFYPDDSTEDEDDERVFSVGMKF